MVNENNLITQIENKKPVELVQELKDEYKIPSYKEFMKGYENDGSLNYDDLSGGDIGTQESYGPGDGWERKRDKDHLITTLNKTVGTFGEHDLWDGEASINDGGNWKMHNVSTSSGVRAGFGGMIAGGSARYSAINVGDDDANFRVGDASVGAEAGAGAGGVTAGYSASVSAVDGKAGPVRGKVGFDVGSNVTVGADGFETKVAGFGISVGKKTGISFGVGEISVDTDDCVIQ